MKTFYCVIFIFSLLHCTQEPAEMDVDPKEFEIDESKEAIVTKATFTGTDNNYNFSVTLKSPDTGCDQYADWWEIIRPNGELIYRRVMGHSHVTEQPFTRSGGPVKITASDSIIIRGHMNNFGYGHAIFSGNIADGLVLDSIDRNFASDLASQEPLPPTCAF